MRLLVLRHGQTNYNLRHLCNSDPRVDVHLTPVGVAQAERAARGLASEPIERILCSPLPRTRHTAQIINRRHRVPVEAIETLVDIHTGFEGRPVDEYFAAIADDPFNTRPPGGESLREFKARIDEVIEAIARRPEACLLVVAHEDTLRIFHAHFHPIEEHRLRELQFPNCACLVFEL